MFIAQIAAKAKANARDVEVEEREAHHTKGMDGGASLWEEISANI
jgi:hypothetical protein